MIMKKLFYARISSNDQNEARQKLSAVELGIDPTGRDFYLDKATGTNFKRPQYDKMIERLKDLSADNIQVTLYVHELDRFGRDYNMIKQQISYIESLGVMIRFMDVPIIETGDPITDQLLRDQFINTLAYVAQRETERRKKRQTEGIAAWKKTGTTKTGNAYGRPKVELPSNFESIYNRVQKGDMKATEAMKILEIKKSTYYKYVGILKESKQKGQMKGQTYLLAD